MIGNVGGLCKGGRSDLDCSRTRCNGDGELSGGEDEKKNVSDCAGGWLSLGRDPGIGMVLGLMEVSVFLRGLLRDRRVGESTENESLRGEMWWELDE